MNSKSIYDELKSGKSAEELRKIFEKEIDAAQTKIKSEEDTSLTKARINLVHAIVTYLQTLDITLGAGLKFSGSTSNNL